MLKLRNLRKEFYGNEIIRGVDLDIQKGDVTAVLGPSGSGKTTLLRCLNFLEQPDAGDLELAGEHYNMAKVTGKDIRNIRRHTAFVFQNYNLFLNKTALQNVTEGLIVSRHMPKEEAEEKARMALEKVGLLEKAASHPSQLSGGQQQRVAIARAIAQEPDIIYLDEPTSALDPELIGEVLSVIRQLAESGMTMLLVTHEMNFARSVANRIVFLDQGVKLRDTTPDEFFNDPGDERIRRFLNTLNNV